MHIEHVAVYYYNLEAAKDFFEKFFSAKVGPFYKNKSGFSSYFLSFENGARLEIMSSEFLRDGVPQDKPTQGFAHLAFSLGSKELVDSLTAKLKQAGFPTISGPRTTGDGYYESCIEGPEKTLIELTV